MTGSKLAVALEPAVLEFDPFDKGNLARIASDFENFAPPLLSVNEETPTQILAPTVATGTANKEELAFAWAAANRDFDDSKLTMMGLFDSSRSYGKASIQRIRNLLPEPQEKVDVQLPLELIARDMTSAIRGGKKGKIDARLEYDTQAFDMQFYVLTLGFGILPERGKKLDYVGIKATLSPACQPQGGGCIRVYELAPTTARESTAHYDGEVRVDGNLKFGVPQGLVPWVNGGLGLKSKSVYTTWLTFSRAIITASTNQNDIVSWSFEKSKTKGDDPRGSFTLQATIGVPPSFRRGKEFKKSFQANLSIKAKVNGWFFTNRREHKIVPVRLGPSVET